MDMLENILESGNEEYASISLQPTSNNFVFTTPTDELRFEPNGEIFINDTLAESDTEVLNTFKKWLKIYWENSLHL